MPGHAWSNNFRASGLGSSWKRCPVQFSAPRSLDWNRYSLERPMALPRLWALDDVTVTDPLPPLASPLLPIPLASRPAPSGASTPPPCRCHLFFLPLTGDARAIRCSLYACIGQREEESAPGCTCASRRTHMNARMHACGRNTPPPPTFHFTTNH